MALKLLYGTPKPKLSKEANTFIDAFKGTQNTGTVLACHHFPGTELTISYDMFQYTDDEVRVPHIEEKGILVSEIAEITRTVIGRSGRKHISLGNVSIQTSHIPGNPGY